LKSCDKDCTGKRECFFKGESIERERKKKNFYGMNELEFNTWRGKRKKETLKLYL